MWLPCPSLGPLPNDQTQHSAGILPKTGIWRICPGAGVLNLTPIATDDVLRNQFRYLIAATRLITIGGEDDSSPRTSGAVRRVMSSWRHQVPPSRSHAMR